MKNDLLQRLIMETGFSYLSDLHSPYCTKAVYSAVCKLSPGEYPPEEWEEAVNYIIGGKGKHFNTPDAALRFLKQELEKPGFS